MTILLIASILYLFSYVLRSLRFWTLFQRPDFSLRSCFVLYHFFSTVGYFVPLIFSEPLKIASLGKLNHSILKAFMAELFARCYDFLFLGCVLLALRPHGAFADAAVVAIGVALIMILLGFVFSEFIRPFKEYLILKSHRKSSLIAVNFIDAIARNLQFQKVKSVQFVLTNVILTMGVWLCECWAFSLVFSREKETSLLDALSFSAANAFSSILRSTDPQFMHELWELRRVQIALAVALMSYLIFDMRRKSVCRKQVL